MFERYKIANNTVVKSEEGNIFYYYNLSDEDKKHLMDNYSLDPHTISSALDPDEIPRLEIENDKYILIWNVPTVFKLVEPESFNIISAGLVLINDQLIIISTENNNYLNEKFTIPITSLFDLIFAFLYNSIKHYIEHLKIIKLMAREIQKKINKSMENKYLIQMFNLSEILVYYLDGLDGNKIALNKLYDHFKSNNISINYNFLSDIIIEINQASKQAEIYSTIFAGLMDARGTIVNNNMNVLIKKLTIINIIFLPLNLIASIGGMSEFSMMTNRVDWKLSYILFSISMILIGWLTLLIINRIEKKERQ